MPSNPNLLRARWRVLALPGSLCAVAVLLSACGGSDHADGVATPPVLPAQVAVSGVVADGPLKGATVCYDLNDDNACDLITEPNAETDDDGKYSFNIDAAAAGRHSVLASVPATAVDKDSGAVVGAAFLLKAPPSGNGGAQAVFVSPLTTVVVDVAADSGRSVAEATALVQAQLGLSVSPLADFTTAGAPVALAQAARAVGKVMIDTAALAATAGVAAAPAARLVREAAATQLPVLAAALAAVPTDASATERSAAAAAAVAEALNLSAATVVAVATQLAAPAGPADERGPFISVRRFAYTDANNYSYVLFTGDSSKTVADGSFAANETRRSMVGGSDIPYSRNQMYWTGSAWQVCDNAWQVITGVQLATASAPQKSVYCGGAQNDSRPHSEDIAGQTLREVITRMRAYPLRDSVGGGTDANGLPVNWGPSPDLLPAGAVFPAGARRSWRSTSTDIGNTDRIELANKSTVRWPDGVYRQATTLAQYSGMPGNLADASSPPGTANTVFVADQPLAAQPDATLEPFKRWRAGLDVAALKVRFYQCDVKKSDQSQPNCSAAGDGTLAISTQGGVRLMRVASGYPAVLVSQLNQQRFWAEHGGTVMRGSTDLPRTRYDQRLNNAAWDTVRSALGIPAHTEPVAPVTAGAFSLLRNFSFTDLANYSWRLLTGDNSQLDANGEFTVSESRKSVVGGVDQPTVRNRSYWTGTEWFDCPDSGVVALNKSTTPFRSTYCKGYVDERTAFTSLSLDGRLMRDVVNDIRAYGQTDGGSSYGSWGPNPNVHTQLASLRFPAGATMDYRGTQPISTPEAIATAAADRVRVAPSPTTGDAFSTWPLATTLDDMVAKYPGSLLGSNVINGNVTLFVWSYTEPQTDAAYTNRVDVRVAFDANGNKARFTRNNRLASNGSSTNHVNLLDTTYSIETVGGVRLLKFATMPDGFENRFRFARRFAERNGGVWYAFKDVVASEPTWSIRLNGSASDALRAALGIQ